MLHTDQRAARRRSGCTIGHHAILHGCTIGENTLIGMRATVLNHARIGANSLVGAGALVTEGKEFPDNSLIVGAPAKAIRVLDSAAVERLRWSSRTMSRIGSASQRACAASTDRMALEGSPVRTPLRCGSGRRHRPQRNRPLVSTSGR